MHQWSRGSRSVGAEIVDVRVFCGGMHPTLPTVSATELLCCVDYLVLAVTLEPVKH